MNIVYFCKKKKS